MSKADIVSSSLMGITTSVGLYTAFLPKINEIRKTPPTSDEATSIRMGELAAGALTVAIGMTASTLVKSPYPAALTIASALAMVCMYEMVLNAPATNPRKAI
jgi:hypothetical protein